jgi:hypothetical protein
VSSATGPNLSTAVAKIEALMDDACIVTYDAEGERDDTLNRTTGAVAHPGSDSSTIYNKDTVGTAGRSLADTDETGGKCKVSPASQSDIASLVTEGGDQQTTQFYKASLPVDSPVLPEGAVLTIVSSRRDPELVDKVFRVREPRFSTFTVSRKYLVELRP